MWFCVLYLFDVMCQLKEENLNNYCETDILVLTSKN
jgi:hypothetical protein